MWPWGHAAVGYLLYSTLLRYRYGRAPAGLSVIALALGTQFPDIVDKPFGWTFGVLPGGRSLAHSLFAVVLVSALVYRLASRYRRPDVGVAFGLGYLSHVLADGLHATVGGEYGELTYLAWPLLPVPEPTIGKSFLAHILALEFDAWFAFEGMLVVLATGLWVYHGTPGLRTFLDPVRTAPRTVDESEEA